MIKIFFFSIAVVALSACSSLGKKSYDVTTLQSIAYALLDLADQKRQQEQWQQAILLYEEAEQYIIRRNDKVLLGISQLKRASVLIQLEQLDAAEKLISKVEQIAQFEAPSLTPSILYIQAKYAFAQNDVNGAIAKLETLKTMHSEHPEKRAYYEIAAWVYQPEATSINQIAKNVAQLKSLKDDGKLENIEIYSFATFQYAKYLSANALSSAPQALEQAIQHFSTLELSNKVRDLYGFAARYYQQVNDQARAKYYKNQQEQLNQMLTQTN